MAFDEASQILIKERSLFKSKASQSLVDLDGMSETFLKQLLNVKYLPI